MIAQNFGALDSIKKNGNIKHYISLLEICMERQELLILQTLQEHK